MSVSPFHITDITTTLCHIVDMYFKAVIRNAKVDYIRIANRAKNNGIVLVTLDHLDYQSAKTIPPPEEIAACGYIQDKGYYVPIHDPNLMAALNLLSDIQRSVLIRNVIYGITLKSLSLEFHLSERMIKKHKHNALDFLRRTLNEIGEK